MLFANSKCIPTITYLNLSMLRIYKTLFKSICNPGFTKNSTSRKMKCALPREDNIADMKKHT